VDELMNNTPLVSPYFFSIEKPASAHDLYLSTPCCHPSTSLSPFSPRSRMSSSSTKTKGQPGLVVDSAIKANFPISYLEMFLLSKLPSWVKDCLSPSV